LLKLFSFLAELRKVTDQFTLSADFQRKFALFLYNKYPNIKNAIKISEEDIIVNSLMEPVYEYVDNYYPKTLQSLCSRFNKDFLEFVKQAQIVEKTVKKASELKNIEKDIVHYNKETMPNNNELLLSYAFSASNSISKTKYIYTHEKLLLVPASISSHQLKIDKDFLEVIKSWDFTVLLKEINVERGKKDVDVEDYVLLFLIKSVSSIKENELKSVIEIKSENMKYLFSV